MTRRAWVLAGAVVVAVASVTGGVVAASGGEDAAPAAQDTPATTAPVLRGPLSAMVALNGTLAYRARPDGSPYAVVNHAEGTYTRLPETGDRIACGGVLYRVDDEPVLLLCGTVPAYRDLAIGDEGRDVRQLNRGLRALGHRVDAGAEFTWRTRDALRALQRDRGAEATGTLDRADAVVLPRAMRIADVRAQLGGSARPGATLAEATSGTLEVRVELAASQQGEVRRGDRARITLPGSRSVGGTVVRLGKVARTVGEGDGPATIPVAVALDRPRRASGLDRAPVQLEIRTKGVRSALSVPVTALVGRSGGGYAVEVVHGRRRALVAVEPGLFDTAAGRVQVAGAVREGDRVVVPTP